MACTEIPLPDPPGRVSTAPVAAQPRLTEFRTDDPAVMFDLMYSLQLLQRHWQAEGGRLLPPTADALRTLQAIFRERHRIANERKVAAFKAARLRVGTDALLPPVPNGSMDVRQCAERLNVGERAVVKAIARGYLPAVKSAGVWWIAVNDFDAFVARRKAAS